MLFLEWVYSLAISVYGFGIKMAAWFGNKKARLWVDGRKGWYSSMRLALANHSAPRIWMHCASLGEFEQGKPVLEALKQEMPNHDVVVTFYSPSGYELRKNTPIADWVFYLPLDTPRNARRFVAVANPSVALFVKYELWFHLLAALQKVGVPCFLLSARFQEGKGVFGFWGFFFRTMLKKFRRIYLQDEASAILLQLSGLDNGLQTGDPRIDRVLQTAAKPLEIEVLRRMSDVAPMLLAGSVWPKEINLLVNAWHEAGKPCSIAIATHEVDEAHLKQVEDAFREPIARLSTWKPVMETPKLLLIDVVGILSSAYRYATVAFVGGGFGKGLHNIFEPLAFGVPVLFGPTHTKQPEGKEAMAKGAGLQVENKQELSKNLELLFGNATARHRMHDAAHHWLQENRGASKRMVADMLQHMHAGQPVHLKGERPIRVSRLPKEKHLER